MKKIEDFAAVPHPVRVIQFGEGNFLRAFADEFIDSANQAQQFDGSVAIVKPTARGTLDVFRAQHNRYTVCLRGVENGRVVDRRRVITCIDRAVHPYEAFGDFLALAHIPTVEFVISNTTEAGIVYDETDAFDANPPKSFPGKLTRLLYERYTAFDGAAERGWWMLPTELIEANGAALRTCVLRLIDRWQLGEAFRRWVENACHFCSTLVDRIVTGYPTDDADALCAELGYEDRLLDAAEPFGLWVIEAPDALRARFQLDQAGLPVVFTDDLQPYRTRKVRILNGAHTSTVLAAYLAGQDTVGACMADPAIRRFMETAVRQEIVPTVPVPRAEADAFADAVFARFENPFVRHALLSIALNSVSKWKARVLPSLLDARNATGALPRCLTFSFAALLAFYTGTRQPDGSYCGVRGETQYPIRDDAAVLDAMADACRLPAAEFVDRIARRTDFWGMDLREIPGFASAAAAALDRIRTVGAAAALAECVQ